MGSAMVSATGTTVVFEGMAFTVGVADGGAKGTLLNRSALSTSRQYARDKLIANPGNGRILFPAFFA